MDDFSEKLRRHLRKLFVTLGVVAVPYAAHAGYGQVDYGPGIDVNGTVRSLETGEPVHGIRVRMKGIEGKEFTSNYEAHTDETGSFHINIPEREGYDIYFTDIDGELNGGFFKHEVKTVTLRDIKDSIDIRLEGEKNTVTIRGIVRSEKDGRIIPGIALRIAIADSHISYNAVTDDNGGFSILIPERDQYNLLFEDTKKNIYRAKSRVLSDKETNASLNIAMEEEKIITIRGIVCSERTGKPIEGIMVRIYQYGTPQKTGETLLNTENFMTHTNDEGYFELLLPEREKYELVLDMHHKGNLFEDKWVDVIPANDNAVLRFELKERERQ
jgi:putative lipoprotein (rSAM/lipoprotein system)